MTIFFQGSTAPTGPRPSHYRGFTLHSGLPQSIGLLWTSEQPVVDTSTLRHTQNTQKTQTSMPLAEFEPANPANERPQKHVLDGTATGISQDEYKASNYFKGFQNQRSMWQGLNISL